jgi:hypothetical protein
MQKNVKELVRKQKNENVKHANARKHKYLC